MEYIVKKKEIKKGEIDHIKIFFDNGDCILISKTEIVDISTRFYDKLIMGGDYWNPFCAVIESGFLKLKLQKKAKGFYANASVYNQKEYNRDRIGYIKNRLCEGGVSCIILYNSNNNEFILYCQTEASLDGNLLNLRFVPFYKNEEYNNDNHFILLPEINKTTISKLELDFENCEGFYFYKKEIVDMQIVFSKALFCEMGGFIRQIESGFLKIKLDPENNEYRNSSPFTDLANGKKGNKQIELRLCSKKGFDLHDICHLYIEYDYENAGFFRRECIQINDIRDNKELKEMEKFEEREGYEFSPCYIGGYAEKVDKDAILITFGKSATKDERCKTMLKEYSVSNNKNK